VLSAFSSFSRPLRPVPLPSAGQYQTLVGFGLSFGSFSLFGFVFLVSFLLGHWGKSLLS